VKVALLFNEPHGRLQSLSVTKEERSKANDEIRKLRVLHEGLVEREFFHDRSMTFNPIGKLEYVSFGKRSTEIHEEPPQEVPPYLMLDGTTHTCVGGYSLSLDFQPPFMHAKTSSPTDAATRYTSRFCTYFALASINSRLGST